MGYYYAERFKGKQDIILSSAMYIGSNCIEIII